MPGSTTLKTLALDTSTLRGNVVLLDGGEIAGEVRLSSLATHSSRLLRSIDFLLSSSGWSFSELQLVAAGIGPGSFTGIRIGMATALALAQSLSIPFAGISGMDAMAHQVQFLEGNIGVVMDAHRSQIYYAEYSRQSGRMQRTVNPVLWSASDLERRVELRPLYLVSGDGVLSRVSSLNFSTTGWPRVVEVELFLAPAIGRLALDRNESRQTGPFSQPEPLYVRPADALRSKTEKG